MKVLYATSEAAPFAASGGLADVAGSLPIALRKRVVGCRVVLPLYQSLSQELRDTLTFVGAISVPVAWRRQYCGVFSVRRDGVIYYLIDNEYYFKREELYGHFDDGERFAFFARAVLEMLPLVDFWPEIIHCNDWQTALTPVYLNAFYREDARYKKIRTLFTIHNIQYQGKYGMDTMNEVFGLGAEQQNTMCFDGCVNLMKAAIQSSDRVSTVSKSYAHEILDPWYSYGLDPILKAERDKLSGILNGIDTVLYDPATDKKLFANFSAEKPENKPKNKRELQKRLGLNHADSTPLIGIVTRLTEQKGLDLVMVVLHELLSSFDVQFAVLGSGDAKYEAYFDGMAAAYPGKLAFYKGFVPELAQKIYGGADMFLMPSKSEPCGLAQMIALRYGTVPVVRATGGLNDSITDISRPDGNGITFGAYNAHDMKTAVERALGAYNGKFWAEFVQRALNSDNGWAKSAGEYIRLYKSMIV